MATLPFGDIKSQFLEIPGKERQTLQTSQKYQPVEICSYHAITQKLKVILFYRL